MAVVCLVIPRDLPQTWRALAAQQRRLGAHAQASTLEWCADELEATLQTRDEELLTVRQAAHETGLSEETVRRHVRSGRLPSQRTSPRGRIRLRRRDLPTRAQPVERRTTSGYDPNEDARNIAQLLESQK